MPIYKYCDRHGVVDPNHHCTTDGTIFTGGSDNQRRARLNKLRGTNTPAWRRLRKVALERDNHHCQLRHRGCTQLADTVHLDPRLNGNHRIATLQDCTSACRHCHGVEDAPRASGR